MKNVILLKMNISGKVKDGSKEMCQSVFKNININIYAEIYFFLTFLRHKCRIKPYKNK